uniref:Uncharacterized protein n=1 Tax=Chromera velia CCMP2878 TaxID=1169474 RepID=A0A0K6S7B6_9ALVE|eukprot:Cvel_20011.t1-p1 / transcript=Cvel_20011.t1 / gene=Cvel_20011 / organism=Chromera_velia_CCMP2878 / gene_product=hypothetical protein / transcript_product=hypothetical protein / location=Cvel_scaffold1765:11046-16237(+) / protein_length=544 / sequence_SO=supercontig / SO=protein_coding / is_pseudo=false
MERKVEGLRVQKQLELWRQKHAKGLSDVGNHLDTLGELNMRFLSDNFKELPSKNEGEYPNCLCCGDSLQACACSWEELLGAKPGSIARYLSLQGNPGMSVGLGCAMEALLESSSAKYHSALSIYWAHIVRVFALLKAREVTKFVALGGRLKPRQEMERRFPSLYLSIEETLQLLVVSNRNEKFEWDPKKARIYALSYGWHSKEHPDPTGITAKTVMEGLAGWAVSLEIRSVNKAEREEYLRLFLDERGGKREKREGEDDEESWMEHKFVRMSVNSLPEKVYRFPVYFQDYTSLHQWPRTPEEDTLFKKGLALLPCLYGNSDLDVIFLRCTEIPAEVEGVMNTTPYHKRGWTTFESRVASTKDEKFTAHFGPLVEGLIQCPLAPPAFQRLLQEKRPEEMSESNKEGFVVRFTNGLEDRPLVANLYRTFVLDTQVRLQKKINFWGRYKIATKKKGEMLGEYLSWFGKQSECEVECVDLEGLHLNDASLPPVAAGLRGLTKMWKLHLSFNRFGPSSLFVLEPLCQLKANEDDVKEEGEVYKRCNSPK